MMSRSIRMVLACAGVLFLSGGATAQGQAPGQASRCPTGDCIAHSTQSQVKCTEETHQAVGDALGWHKGLSTNADQKILGGHIAGYQIKWSNGAWSTWFVPGQNDIDWKFNPGSNEMRRAWSYFGDHEHRYIICR